MSRAVLARFFPYLLLGGAVFYGNSSLELPYFIRGYLALIESQLGLVILYFLVLKRHRIVSIEKNHEK
jgi:hypothetical protein